MAGYLPVMLDVSGQKIAVIGGGTVAERKVQSLLEAGAAVTVISPALTAVLSGLVEEGKIQWVARGYEPGDVRGAFLVYAASSDPAVNGNGGCRSQGAWTAGQCSQPCGSGEFYNTGGSAPGKADCGRLHIWCRTLCCG